MPSLGSSLDLSLECRSYTKLSSTPVLRSPSVSEDGEETVNFEDYVKGLEEERLKIEAFKRELPFSVQLLNDVIEASKRLQENYVSEKRQMEEGRNGLKPAIEEIIPANKISKEAEGNKFKVTASYAKDDMPNWMSSVELWSRSNENKQATVWQKDSHPQETSPSNPTKNLSGSKNRVGGAFLPFSKERKENLRCTDLRLSSDGDEVCSCPSTCNTLVNFYNNEDDDEGSMDTAEAQDERTLTRTKSTDRGNTNPTPNTPPTNFHSSQRKTRRSWSLELHQKFVKALQQLGGAQATPKQIKEAMNVDGLTNDEVKSHLQKYRLQTRKPSCEGSQSCVSIQQSSAAPPLLVVGGIWVPPEYAKHPIPPSMAVYTPLPNQSHGHYYYQQPPPPIGVDHFCSERKAPSS